MQKIHGTASYVHKYAASVYVNTQHCFYFPVLIKKKFRLCLECRRFQQRTFTLFRFCFVSKQCQLPAGIAFVVPVQTEIPNNLKQAFLSGVRRNSSLTVILIFVTCDRREKKTWYVFSSTPPMYWV